MNELELIDGIITLEKVILYRVFNCRVHNSYPTSVIPLKRLIDQDLAGCSFSPSESLLEIVITERPGNESIREEAVDWFEQYDTEDYYDGGLEFMGYFRKVVHNGITPYRFICCVPHQPHCTKNGKLQLIFRADGGIYRVDPIVRPYHSIA